MSAYQLAKKVEISRPSIYNALEHMVNKGIIACVPNKTPFYVATKPELFLKKINDDMKESMANATLLLKEFEKTRMEEKVVVIRGFDHIILEVKDILKHATHDIYINTDFDLNIFSEEFAELDGKGVKVTAFSFYDVDKGNKNVALYSHGRNKMENAFSSRLMLAEYDRISIAASRNSRFDDWSAIVSNLPLSVRMIEEQIHNDIYMLELKENYGKQIYDKIRIGTEFEKENRMQKEEQHI